MEKISLKSIIEHGRSEAINVTGIDESEATNEEQIKLAIETHNRVFSLIKALDEGRAKIIK